MLAACEMSRWVSGDPVSEMAHIANGMSHLDSSIYDCQYIERLAFAFQSKGAGMIEIYVSDNLSDWVQMGRYEASLGLSVENQVAYMPRFCYARFTRFDMDKPMLCVIQKTPYVLASPKEFGLEVLCTTTPS